MLIISQRKYSSDIEYWQEKESPGSGILWRSGTGPDHSAIWHVNWHWCYGRYKLAEERKQNPETEGSSDVFPWGIKLRQCLGEGKQERQCILAYTQQGLDGEVPRQSRFQDLSSLGTVKLNWRNHGICCDPWEIEGENRFKRMAHMSSKGASSGSV